MITPPNPHLVILAFIVKILAATMAVWVARGRREYVPIAVVLIISAVADILRLVISGAMPPTSETASSSPGVIVLYAVDSALWLTWPAGLAASALVVFLDRKPWAVLIAWAALAIGLAVSYPWARGENLRLVYLGAELTAQAVALGGALLWSTRRSPPGAEHAVLALLVAVELGTLIAGPWRAIYTTWYISQLMYLGAFAAIIAVQGGALWRSRQS